MLDTMDIARRVKSRFAKISSGYASGPIRTERNHTEEFLSGREATVDFLHDGYRFRARIATLVTSDDPRPETSDVVTDERRKYHQLKLAELASAAILDMARISNREPDVENMSPWFKDGVAGFVTRCTFGVRFIVEISEITLEDELLAAKAFVESRVADQHGA